MTPRRAELPDALEKLQPGFSFIVAVTAHMHSKHSPVGDELTIGKDSNREGLQNGMEEE